MNKKIIAYHILAWVCFMVYEVSTIYFVVGKTSSLTDYVVHYAINIILFYLHAKLVISYQSSIKKILITICEIATYISVNCLLNKLLESFSIQITRPSALLQSLIIASFWRCLYFIGLSSLYGLFVKLIWSRKSINKLEKAKLIAEKEQVLLEKNLLATQNMLLRSQINPHLFFNTLNFVFNSIHKISREAGEAVMLLSDITRYSIASIDGGDTVHVADEIAHIQNLISLNQIRFNGNLNILLKVESNLDNYTIIPLVLLTITENVFKYGNLSTPCHPAVISIAIADDTIHFSTMNKKAIGVTLPKGNGIGLSNSIKRLENSYPGAFTLNVNDTQDYYQVNLFIKVDCLC